MSVQLEQWMLTWALMWLVLSCAPAQSGDRTEPYRDLSTAGAGFLGPGREDLPPAGLKTVRLGIVCPANTPAGDRFRSGVGVAVSEANTAGGYGGVPYEVVFRPDDGPWGMGAKQITALAYEDSVWAILGGLDGGSAHLAELVAAKLWVPVITPTASDMTIDYANVPWVFRCFPSDVRQARKLLEYAQDNHLLRLIVFVVGDREGRTGLCRVEDEARSAGVSLIERHEYLPHLPQQILAGADLHAADAVLIWGGPESALSLLRALRATGFARPVLGPATLISPDFLSAAEDLGPLVIAAPYDLAADPGARGVLCGQYPEQMGEGCDPVTLFAYDATRLLMAAIQRAGLNRARIRDALADSRFEGIVGTFQFDTLGGALLEPVLITWGDGIVTRIGGAEDTGQEGANL
ncbi:ABC transporter substrate-binding protein [Candidatus Eisenbacteria bacterium]|uniref:ABC transporter substrate-binding protein n=1 Tax=Eiseniibacteriota bacterium TaxID=2212470 RepID=A0ABV6YL42_UNCEI